MRREGYSPAFCVAVTSCAAMMAPIIPPSVIAVIYGSVTGVSIGALFLGGAIPGVVAGIAMMAITWFLAPRAGARPIPRTASSEALAATVRAIPAMVMPILVIGGILSGAFTPTEAGAVAALYALLFGLVMRRHSAATLYRTSPAPSSPRPRPSSPWAARRCSAGSSPATEPASPPCSCCWRSPTALPSPWSC
jgi:TRAP-type C4-dicarboxylate transport system permease large subunit